MDKIDVLRKETIDREFSLITNYLSARGFELKSDDLRFVKSTIAICFSDGVLAGIKWEMEK